MIEMKLNVNNKWLNSDIDLRISAYLCHYKSYSINLNASAVNILGDKSSQQFQTLVMWTRINDDHSKISVGRFRFQQNVLNER